MVNVQPTNRKLEDRARRIIVQAAGVSYERAAELLDQSGRSVRTAIVMARKSVARDEAFELLYRRYVKDVYHYALALLRNPADAEDVTQTTFMNAYRAYQRGEQPRKPQHWLIKIAHNACRTRYLRNARRPVEVPLDESLAHVPVPASNDMNVEELLAALGDLPFRQRAALVLRELDGRSYREIAETLEVTVPAVETLIFRARSRSRRSSAAGARSRAAGPCSGPGSRSRSCSCSPQASSPVELRRTASRRPRVHTCRSSRRYAKPSKTRPRRSARGRSPRS